jgi:hypothetical protein
MRSRETNILQAVVLGTGIVYIVTGILFYLSPLTFAGIFGITAAEDWFNQIRYDAVISAIYFLGRGFAALLFSSGLSMILPLFDPFRYRGLVYFTGILFPLMAAVMLFVSGARYQHAILTIMGIVFALVFALTIFGVAITSKKARAGDE